VNNVRETRTRRSMQGSLRTTWLCAAAGFVLLATAACERGATTPVADAVRAEASETGSIGGIVLGLDGSPVAGARVTTPGGASATTGPEGKFGIDGLAPTSRLPVTVSAQGFAPTTEIYKVAAGERAVREIRVLGAGEPVQITAGKGGVVPFGGTGSLVVPANAFANVASGEVVTVRVAYYDPTDPASIAAAPGDLSAVEADGSLWLLRTNGMVFVTATNAQGRRLDLAPGQVAQANLPDRANDGTAWSSYRFDPVTGLWVWIAPAIAAPGVQRLPITTLTPTYNIDVPTNPIPSL
jgi:hypothetical protein